MTRDSADRPLVDDELALLAAFEAGDATPDERRTAEALLEASPQARAALARLAALGPAVAAATTPTLPEASQRRIGDRLEAAARDLARARVRRRRVALGGLGAALAAAALIVVAGRRPSPVAPTVVAQRSTRPAPGAIVRTGPGGYQLLPIGDRALAFLGEETVVQVGDAAGGPALRVIEGTARLVVRRDPAHPFVVGTRAADVQVLGTEFDVVASGDAVRVHVVRGQVEVRNLHGTRRLWAHEDAIARVDSSPRVYQSLKPLVLGGPGKIDEQPAAPPP